MEEIQELQQIAAYQEVGMNNSERAVGEDEEQTIEFDDVEDETPDTLSSITMEPPSRRPSQPEMVDTSEPVMHKRSRGALSKFVLAMGLWAEQCGLFQSNYNAL